MKKHGVYVIASILFCLTLVVAGTIYFNPIYQLGHPNATVDEWEVKIYPKYIYFNEAYYIYEGNYVRPVPKEAEPVGKIAKFDESSDGLLTFDLSSNDAPLNTEVFKVDERLFASTELDKIKMVDVYRKVDSIEKVYKRNWEIRDYVIYHGEHYMTYFETENLPEDASYIGIVLGTNLQGIPSTNTDLYTNFGDIGADIYEDSEGRLYLVGETGKKIKVFASEQVKDALKNTVDEHGN